MTHAHTFGARGFKNDPESESEIERLRSRRPADSQSTSPEVRARLWSGHVGVDVARASIAYVSQERRRGTE
ncbi:hypothetical protein C9J85_11775 [Haloferax sp. wsp5]|nr:hypothetical protein C9J85_11775 [Haloferax sp. wsp5]